MVSYKLIYFELKGRAEVSRILFELADQKFEDYKIKFEDWHEEKQKLPFLQAPVLEIKTENKTYRICQSLAIQRFLAKKFALDGKNEFEAAQADMICEQVNDLFQMLIRIYVKPNGEEKNKEVDEAMNKGIHNGLKLIQNLLDENKDGNGFLVGDSLTYADVVLVNFYDWLRESKPAVLDKLVSLKQHYNKIRNYPIIKEHMDKNEKTRLTILFPN
nr:glutathione S-transferase GSTS8-2 [Brachionus angularis]